MPIREYCREELGLGLHPKPRREKNWDRETTAVAGALAAQMEQHRRRRRFTATENHLCFWERRRRTQVTGPNMRMARQSLWIRDSALALSMGIARSQPPSRSSGRIG